MRKGKNLELLSECRETIEWMWENMAVKDSSLQSDAFNIPANTLSELQKVLPPREKDVFTPPPCDNFKGWKK